MNIVFKASRDYINEEVMAGGEGTGGRCYTYCVWPRTKASWGPIYPRPSTKPLLSSSRTSPTPTRDMESSLPTQLRPSFSRRSWNPLGTTPVMFGCSHGARTNPPSSTGASRDQDSIQQEPIGTTMCLRYTQNNRTTVTTLQCLHIVFTTKLTWIAKMSDMKIFFPHFLCSHVCF